ncbi:hypothetical protein FDUTEX481_02274 [Tolypothrix sp. PCC 7601]|nr:hypothetical protein FDUTEX481_02274 [Tolypothrix sp. PCC 7601]
MNPENPKKLLAGSEIYITAQRSSPVVIKVWGGKLSANLTFDLQNLGGQDAQPTKD